MATHKINNYINELLNEDPVTGMLGYGLGKSARKTERRDERGSQQQTAGSNTNTNTNTQNVGNVQGGNVTTTGGNINSTQNMGNQNVSVNVNAGSGSAGGAGGGGNPLTNPYRPGGSKEIGIGDVGGEEKPEKPTPPEAMPQPKPIAPKPEPTPIAPAPKPEPTPIPVPGDPGDDPGYRGLPPFFKPGPYDQSDEDGNRIPGRPPAKPAPAPRPRPDLVPDLDDTKPPVFNPGAFGQNPFAQPGPGQTRGPRRRPIPPPSFSSGGGDFFPMESLSLESRRRGVREVYSSGLDVVLSTINERRRDERGGMSNTNTQNVGNVTGGNITTSGGNINSSQNMGNQNVSVNNNTGSGRAGGNYTQPAPQQPQQPAPQQPAPAPAPKPRPMPRPTPVPPGARPMPRPGFPMPGGPAPAPKPLFPGGGIYKPMEPGRPGKPKPKPDPKAPYDQQRPFSPEELERIREMLRPKPPMEFYDLARGRVAR